MRLRYNNALGTLGASLASGGTTISFVTAPPFATIVPPDYIPLVIDPPSDPSPNSSFEIVYLTAFSAGASTGTITRGQEGTTPVSHIGGAVWLCGPTGVDLATQARFSQVFALATDSTGSATPAAIAASGSQKTVSGLRLQSNGNCRIRFYSRAADRSADLSRIATVDPANTAGVLLEVVFNATVRDVVLGPPVDLWSLDDATKPFIIALDGGPLSSTVNITLTAIGME
jgi:hypothetical protein